MGYKVFICYRRVDKEFARSIERELVAEFGVGSVFLDTDEVSGGVHWQDKVVEVFRDSPVVVTLITTTWNSRRKGKPRLLDEEDYIRFELESALEHNLLIVPVLYERANWPKPNDLPPDLRAVLGFQRVPFSNDRWNYDAQRLVRALTDLGVAPSKPPVQPQSSQTGPFGVSSRPRATFKPSMFREDLEARKVRLAAEAAALNAERERKQRIRAEAEPFYKLWEFWLAAAVTVAAGAAAVVGAELLTRTVADRWISLPGAPIVAGVVLVAVWAGARIAVGAAAYWGDPSRGARVFYLRGLLGGYTLWLSEWEPIAAWTAFPIATVLSWCLARGIAWPAYHYLHWSYDLIFWLVLAAYTLYAVAGYVVLTDEEINLF